MSILFVIWYWKFWCYFSINPFLWCISCFWQTYCIVKVVFSFLILLLLEFPFYSSHMESFEELWPVMVNGSAPVSTCSIPCFHDLNFHNKYCSHLTDEADFLTLPLATQGIAYLLWNIRKCKSNIYSFTSFGESIEM